MTNLNPVIARQQLAEAFEQRINRGALFRFGHGVLRIENYSFPNLTVVGRYYERPGLKWTVTYNSPLFRKGFGGFQIYNHVGHAMLQGIEDYDRSFAEALRFVREYYTTREGILFHRFANKPILAELCYLQHESVRLEQYVRAGSSNERKRRA